MKFKAGLHEKEAREYLKELGIYELLVASAKKNVFKDNNYPLNDGFMMIIAANDEWKKRNKLTAQ